MMHTEDIYNLPSTQVQRNVFEFSFCPRIRLRVVSIIGDRLTLDARLDSINKVHAIEDSIYYVTEKIRCDKEKDSIKLASFSGRSILSTQSHDNVRRDNVLNSLDTFGKVSECDCFGWGPITVRTSPRIRGAIYTQVQLDSIQMAHARADSIYIARKIRCDREKDSIRFANFSIQHEDSTQLLQLTEFTRTLKHKNVQSELKKERINFENDSAEYIDFWMLDPFENISVGDYAEWGILRDQPEEISSADKRTIDSLINEMDYIDTKTSSVMVCYECNVLIPKDTILIQVREGSEMDSDDLNSIDGDIPNIDFSFYPNPATSFININVSHEVKLELVDINGKVVLNRIISPGTTMLDIQELGTGYYFFSLGDKRFKLLIAR